MPRSTARSVFVDTGGFFSLLVRNDDQHQPAVAHLARSRKRGGCYVTTDYVLDETATLLMMRGYGHLVNSFFDTVFRSEACRIEWMDTTRFDAACQFFVKHRDHRWSFTDCFSFLVMKEQRLHDALTKDKHFEEAGFTPLLSNQPQAR